VKLSAFCALLMLMLTPSAYAEGAAAPTVSATYSDEVCEDFQRIASEFIEMELSGLRWQGVAGDPSCLKKFKPLATSIDRIPASDPSLLDPEFLIPENRKIDFSVRRIPNDLLEVVMNYIGKKNKKDVPVKDRFVLKLNFGQNRAAKGCASWYSEPDHFVMRSRCWKD
jgi:hypothetical protein